MVKNNADERVPMLDGVRFVAAVSVIWLHTLTSEVVLRYSVLGRFAVPFFTASSVLFVVKKAFNSTNVTFCQYARDRLVRLYLPFVSWSLLYIIVRYAASLFNKHTSIPVLGVDILWTGPVHHLWFLPFLLFSSVLLFVFFRAYRHFFHLDRVLLLLFVIAGFYLAVTPRPDWVVGLGYTFGVSYNTMPALMWGAALALRLFGRSLNDKPNLSKELGLIGIFGVASSTIYLLAYGRDILIENIAGFSALLFVLGINDVKALRGIAPLGSLAFGIYLCHLLWVEGLQDVFSILSIKDNLLSNVSIFVMSTIGSISMAKLINITRLKTVFGT